MKHVDAKPSPRVCVACRDNPTKKNILTYKRIYLYLADCKKHLDMWDAADAESNAKETKKGKK